VVGSGFNTNNSTVLEFDQNGQMVASIPAFNVSGDGTQFQVSLGAVFVANVPPGVYQVHVINSNGRSNVVNFTLTLF
jgi:hypothetical protein